MSFLKEVKNQLKGVKIKYKDIEVQLNEKKGTKISESSGPFDKPSTPKPFK